jgi:hypothetical protein
MLPPAPRVAAAATAESLSESSPSQKPGPDSFSQDRYQVHHIWLPEALFGYIDPRSVIAGYYWTALTMSKIGRYIATTMPPTTTPRNTIINGSNSASNPETAASTSSS